MISSGAVFFLVFTALYLLESVTVCSSGAVIFYRGLTGAVKFRFAKNLPEFGKGRIFLSPFFPPAVSPLITGSMPVLFSHEGFSALTAHGDGCSFFTLDRVERIGTLPNAVTVNGSTLFKVHSGHEAEWWKERLLRLSRAKAGQREQAALRIIDEIFDHKAPGDTIAAQKDSTFFLSLLVESLFMYCFVIVPVLSWFFSIEAIWPVLLAVFLLQDIAITLLFVFSYRKIFPQSGAPWSRVVSMILYPPSLLRCMDSICKTSLVVFHPVAVARVICKRETMLEVMSYYYRQYVFAPAAPLEGKAQEAAVWFRQHAAGKILQAALDSGITRDELVAPPERKDDEIITYCPCCHEQYVIESGMCSECGIRLVSYNNYKQN